MDLEIAKVQAGDVLICYSNLTAEEETAGETGYSHTAIALASERVLDSSSEGVQSVRIGKLLEDYDHIAVLRELNPYELWDEARLRSLDKFADQSRGKKFKKIGLVKFPPRKEIYKNNLTDEFMATLRERCKKSKVTEAFTFAQNSSLRPLFM